MWLKMEKSLEVPRSPFLVQRGPGTQNPGTRGDPRGACWPGRSGHAWGYGRRIRDDLFTLPGSIPGFGLYVEDNPDERRQLPPSRA